MKAWVWLVAVTALVEERVVAPGVPKVIAPEPVMVVKFIPLPAETEVTVPAGIFQDLFCDKSKVVPLMVIVLFAGTASVIPYPVKVVGREVREEKA
ncbi:hypothetical protein SDC9_131906 [bioreactor metagenome]|uniref:Uncharacterized protein n=1 Tax=bioreactor metagenome TaxID=1076179 RepID=A0A645D5P7_9ZZZZ